MCYLSIFKMQNFLLVKGSLPMNFGKEFMTGLPILRVLKRFVIVF